MTGLMILLIILLIIIFRKWIGLIFIAIIFAFAGNRNSGRRLSTKFLTRALAAILIGAIIYLLVKF